MPIVRVSGARALLTLALALVRTIVVEDRMEAIMVGLLIRLGGYIAWAEQQGDLAAMRMIDRLKERAIDIGHRFGMSPMETPDGGLLLIGPKQEAALGAAFAFTEESLPEDGYLPVHLAVVSGEVVQLEDGQTVELVAQVKATAHPGELQPVKRG